MSVKDEIEKIWLERVKKGAEEENLEHQQQWVEQAINWFRPVYLTCLEIEKEFGQGRGIEIEVKKHCCTIEATHELADGARLYVYCLNPKEIVMTYEVGDWSVRVPDKKNIETTKEAIKEILNWVGNNISLDVDT